MLRGAGEVNWRPGLGEAARPAAVRLRQALLGWTAREPVPASEAFARDGPAWQQRADAGEAPAEGPAPSPPPLEPWEVEDGPTGDELEIIAGSEERLRARLAGKARRWSPGAVHREPIEAAGGPTYHGRSRRSRGDGGVAASDGAEDRHGAGGDGGDGGGGDGDGSRKRPLQGGAERPGSSGADGEDDRGRPAGGAAGADGGAADGGYGGGTGAGRRNARDRKKNKGA